MRSLEILTHIEAARRDEADTPADALDRVRVRILRSLVREHLDLGAWHEKQATAFERELTEILTAHGWVDSADVEEDGEDTECPEF